ncbi:hypothetical protein KAR34_03425 [bacterium]|nr:hypothetical protein [bacterium]
MDKKIFNLRVSACIGGYIWVRLVRVRILSMQAWRAFLIFVVTTNYVFVE